MGLSSPLVIRFKVLFQKVWIANIGWDSPVPEPIAKEWTKIIEDLNEGRVLSFPRRVISTTERFEIHLFSDASIQAYATAAYICSNIDDTITVSLLCNKTCVAPKLQNL